MRQILTAVALLLCMCITTSARVSNDEQTREPIATGAVSAHLVGRMVVDASGTAQWIGYCPYIAGIPGPFFSGEPSEATAFFTFRSTPFQEQTIANGNITVLFPNAVGSAPLEVRVYFNGNPNGNFQDPDTFSEGQLIARFQPQRAMGTDIGSVTTAAGTYDVVSGSDFTFQGQTYNLKELSHASTFCLTFGPPLSEAAPYAAVFCFGGYALAVGRPDDRAGSWRQPN